jgi:hypothetical protein
MSQVTILVLAFLGLLALIAGGFAMRRNWSVSGSGKSTQLSRRAWWIAIGFGVLLGIASWPLTYFMGYPLRTEVETGRIVGIPFMVAYFDAQGRDYVGPITLLGAVANTVFWFLVPQMLLRLIRKGAGRVQTE